MLKSFDFEPLVVWIYAYMVGTRIMPVESSFPSSSDGILTGVLPVYELSTTYKSGQGFGSTPWDTEGKRSDDGKTIYWYNSSSSEGVVGQLNISDRTYYYIAFG